MLYFFCSMFAYHIRFALLKKRSSWSWSLKRCWFIIYKCSEDTTEKPVHNLMIQWLFWFKMQSKSLVSILRFFLFFLFLFCLIQVIRCLFKEPLQRQRNLLLHWPNMEKLQTWVMYRFVRCTRRGSQNTPIHRYRRLSDRCHFSWAEMCAKQYLRVVPMRCQSFCMKFQNCSIKKSIVPMWHWFRYGFEIILNPLEIWEI